MIYCMLFSLYRRIIIKKKEPLPARTGSLFHQNTSRRKYPDIMIRIFDLFCKLKDIKISDQEWFDQAVRSLDLSVQPCPYCHSKGHLIPHDVYSRYMVTLKGHRPVMAVLRVQFDEKDCFDRACVTELEQSPLLDMETSEAFYIVTKQEQNQFRYAFQNENGEEVSILLEYL